MISSGGGGLCQAYSCQVPLFLIFFSSPQEGCLGDTIRTVGSMMCIQPPNGQKDTSCGSAVWGSGQHLGEVLGC